MLASWRWLGMLLLGVWSKVQASAAWAGCSAVREALVVWPGELPWFLLMLMLLQLGQGQGEGLGLVLLVLTVVLVVLVRTVTCLTYTGHRGSQHRGQTVTSPSKPSSSTSASHPASHPAPAPIIILHAAHSSSPISATKQVLHMLWQCSVGTTATAPSTRRMTD